MALAVHQQRWDSKLSICAWRVQLTHVTFTSTIEWTNLAFVKGALGNYFNLIKPFRNHLNGSITCSGENWYFPHFPQCPLVENQPCNMGTNVPVSWKYIGPVSGWIALWQFDIILSHKKRYKSCRWGCPFSKGTLLYPKAAYWYFSGTH